MVAICSLELYPKVPDMYSGHLIHSILQGIQFEPQSGRTRSDRSCSIFARANKSYSYYLQAHFCDKGSASYYGIDESMQ